MHLAHVCILSGIDYNSDALYITGDCLVYTGSQLWE